MAYNIATDHCLE